MLPAGGKVFTGTEIVFKDIKYSALGDHNQWIYVKFNTAALDFKTDYDSFDFYDSPDFITFWEDANLLSGNFPQPDRNDQPGKIKPGES